MSLLPLFPVEAESKTSPEFEFPDSSETGGGDGGFDFDGILDGLIVFQSLENSVGMDVESGGLFEAAISDQAHETGGGGGRNFVVESENGISPGFDFDLNLPCTDCSETFSGMEVESGGLSEEAISDQAHETGGGGGRDFVVESENGISSGFDFDLNLPCMDYSETFSGMDVESGGLSEEAISDQAHEIGGGDDDVVESEIFSGSAQELETGGDGDGRFEVDVTLRALLEFFRAFSEMEGMDVESGGLFEEVFSENLKRRGLSEEVISEHLKTRNNNSDEVVGEEDVCPVCLDDLCRKDPTVAVLYCGHEYHSCCIKQWLQRRNVCPLCKRTALPQI